MSSVDAANEKTASCVSTNDIESAAYLRGAFCVMLATSDASADEVLRSITYVASTDLSDSACLRDAVVTMGENSDSFAS